MPDGGAGSSQSGSGQPRDPTLREVAARAGVSIKTVSNVVNHRVGVRPATRARVEQSVAELGYRPNEVARVLRRGPDDALTLIVPRTASGDLRLAVDLLIRCARELGCRIVPDVADSADTTDTADTADTRTRLLVISD